VNVCDIDGCDRRPQARGMCNPHYLRWRRAEGRVDGPYPPGTPHGFDAPPPPGPWVANAACRGLPTDWWFSERGENEVFATAQAICKACPVVEPCRDYGLAHASLTGTWGALSERQRRLERQRMRVGGRPS
jgi:WhiB family redox-sensing transcriptional regulator